MLAARLPAELGCAAPRRSDTQAWLKDNTCMAEGPDRVDRSLICHDVDEAVITQRRDKGLLRMVDRADT